MEATDLRIGDWVSLSGTPVKVLSIMSLEEAYVCQAVGKGLLAANYPSNLEPIKLTSDILQANGFSEGVMYSWLNIDEHKTLEYYYYEHELREWWHGVDEWNNHKEEKELSFLCQVHYVHELQHALRLCGLDDLANNFKVE